MNNKVAIARTDPIYIDSYYKNLLQDIKSRLHVSQMRAAIKVNTELLHFYWDVGNLILEHQKIAKWGDKIFEALSFDLTNSFPNTKGFSKTNLKNMRMFAMHYDRIEIGQALPDQLTWSHHVVLMQSFNKDTLMRKRWYANQAILNGWSYRAMQEHIQDDLYARQSDNTIKSNNFDSQLPPEHSRLAQDMIKDPYKFHFLTIGEDAYEKEIQNGLLGHTKQFLMELGQGFALYGTNYPIHVSDKRFEIDLLMYNTKLHCYVVIEIKRGDFKPEHTGQLNFYLSAVDEQLKTPEDGPTIGLLLCENKDQIIAEYALNRVNSPIGISQYQLLKSLPLKLHDILPTTDELEAELNNFTAHKNQQ